MDRDRSTGLVISVSLLGSIAIAALVTSVVFFFGAWVVTDGANGLMPNVGGTAALLLGLLVLGFGVLAAAASRLLWIGRPAGRVLGLVVGIVATLSAVTALVIGDVPQSAPLLWVVVGLGVATMVPLVLPDRQPQEGKEGAR
jgi:hypothetical protein